jgi:hypothetical protein
MGNLTTEATTVVRSVLSVGINSFARRQTKDSPYSYWTGSDEELLKRVRSAKASDIKPGYKDGVIIVPVDPDGFYSGVVELTGDSVITGHFGARRENEEPVLEVRATGHKVPAKFVEVILYSKEALDGEVGSGADWDIISINGRATEEEEPMHPVAMARNQLRRVGGSPAEYTSDQWAKAVWYWAKRAMHG